MEINLRTLLRNYHGSQSLLRGRKDELPATSTLLKELRLFARHFLLDREIFRSFGFERLSELNTSAPRTFTRCNTRLS